ncbi:MAG: ABC transporter permease [Thermodesulfobacteriota bacterium]
MSTAPPSVRLISHALTSAVIAFLLLPILAVVPASFNHASFIRLPPARMSLRWYQAFFADPDWIRSLLTSLEVALLATGLAVVLGMLAALGLEKCSTRVRAAILALVISPMIVPVIMTSIALYYVSRPLGLHGTVLGVALGHTILCLPFAVINIGVSLKGLDPTLLKAAEGLGARPWYAFRTVTLPIVLPGLAGAAAFAFITSFDEVVISIFLAGLQAKTLPVKMWEMVRVEFTPVMAVASTLLVALTLLMFLAFQWARRRRADRRAP